MKKIFLAAVALLALSPVAYAKTIPSMVCDGKISWYPLSAYTAIDSPISKVDSGVMPCLFVTRSRIGQQILRTCPKESLCQVVAIVENIVPEYYEIKRVISVKRVYDAYVVEEKPVAPEFTLPSPQLDVAK